MDDVSLGCTPADEDCEQLGAHYNPDQARRECRAYIAQLRRQAGPEPDGARLKIQANAHDFGTYYEVVCRFNPGQAPAADYAWALERATPGRWDADARAELGLDAWSS